jgi:predicted Fe-S protein YdhL (DUF1289 family)
MKCQNKCALDKITQICKGCGRSLEEIKQAFEEYKRIKSK